VLNPLLLNIAGHRRLLPTLPCKSCSAPANTQSHYLTCHHNAKSPPHATTSNWHGMCKSHHPTTLPRPTILHGALLCHPIQLPHHNTSPPLCTSPAMSPPCDMPPLATPPHHGCASTAKPPHAMCMQVCAPPHHTTVAHKSPPCLTSPHHTACCHRTKLTAAHVLPQRCTMLHHTMSTTPHLSHHDSVCIGSRDVDS
jgi:hypothetical protein